METTIPLGYYKDLIIQTEIDFKNLKKSFETFKINTSDKKIFSEICQSYSFLLQDISYIEKYKQSIYMFEMPISVKFPKNLNKIKTLLKEVKEFF
jgi:hypothetical protein